MLSAALHCSVTGMLSATTVNSFAKVHSDRSPLALMHSITTTSRYCGETAHISKVQHLLFHNDEHSVDEPRAGLQTVE